MADQHAMDEQVLDEIRFHQDVVTRDANSPLFQIREKEMEIAGRVLAARTEAEKLVASARQNASDTIKNAEATSEQLAKERSEQVLAETEVAVASVKPQGVVDTAELEQSLAARQADAVDLVVRLVTTVR
jgi:vacuolar-type H+-ATPase subunit H